MRNRPASLAGVFGLALLTTLLVLHASGMASTALAAALGGASRVRHQSEPPIRHDVDPTGGPVYSLVNGPVYGPSAAPVYDLGAPMAEGTSVRVSLAAPSEQALLTFSIRGPGPGSIALFVGDQWYDVDAALYRRGQTPGLIDGAPIVVLDRSERRRLQFMSPEDVLLPSMPAGEYVLVVGPKGAPAAATAADFVAGRDFLVRVAVGAPLCALTPPNDPSSGTHPDDALYQLGLAAEPASPGQSSLLTFTAVVSPPFTDLFDFSWGLDGVTVDGATGPIYQAPGREVSSTPGSQHTITLVARGAREYRDATDPTFSHLPLNGGTISVSCTFGLGS